MKPWLRLTLITATVGGGFSGIAITLQLLVGAHRQPVIYHLLIFGFLVLFGFVLASGLLFVQNPQRTGPLVVALGLQVPWVSSPLVAYKFAAGFQFSAALIGWHVNGGFRLGSDFQINFFQKLHWGAGINLFALGLLVLLLRAIRKTAEEAQPVAPGIAPLPLRGGTEAQSNLTQLANPVHPPLP